MSARVSVHGQTVFNSCVRQYSLCFSQFAADYHCLVQSLLQTMLLFLSPPPPHLLLFIWIIITSFFPLNSTQSHFSLKQHQTPSTPTGEKQTFKASQTMSHLHTHTHTSMKRHTPAEGHQEALNRHNGLLIIIHKGDFCVSAAKWPSSTAWIEPGVSHNTHRWSTLWRHWNRLTHTNTHIQMGYQLRHTCMQISWLCLIVTFQLATKDSLAARWWPSPPSGVTAVKQAGGWMDRMTDRLMALHAD